MVTCADIHQIRAISVMTICPKLTRKLNALFLAERSYIQRYCSPELKMLDKMFELN